MYLRTSNTFRYKARKDFGIIGLGAWVGRTTETSLFFLLLLRKILSKEHAQFFANFSFGKKSLKVKK